MWKLLFQSVRGPAHVRGGLPCQDQCLVRLRRSPRGSALILACADGAGSALHADLGAWLACRSFVTAAAQSLANRPPETIDLPTVTSWLTGVRDDLHTAAGLHEVEPYEFACTLLAAVVGETGAVFVQIGDGAIVVGDQDGYRPVSWPQRGEYANSTNFVTDEDWDEFLDFTPHAGPLDEVALLTDGVQNLALNLAAQSVHVPFFKPMFERLRAARPGEVLPRALRRFLESPPSPLAATTTRP